MAEDSFFIPPDRRYGKWAGNPKGFREDPERCVWEVFPNDGQRIGRQCQNRRKAGSEGDLCQRHFTEWKRRNTR